MMMSHRVHTHKHRTTDRTTNLLLISSNVYYVHLGGDNTNHNKEHTVIRVRRFEMESKALLG